MPAADFVDARDLDEALGALAERGSDATVLAGGTDVMVQLLRGDIAPPTLLHVRGVRQLAGVALDGRTTLGALTTHWTLRTDERLRRAHPALAEAAATVGGRQTQNVGTLAGNVVNASPAGDLLPPLLVADARVGLASRRGERVLALEEFVLGRRRTARDDDELVTRLEVEPVGARGGETYVKLGRRRAMEVAIVGLACRLTLDAGGAVEEARLALCSVAPAPFRAREAERALAGTRLEPDAVRAAAEALRAAASPIDDARATARYRIRVLEPLLERALATCAERARGAAWS